MNIPSAKSCVKLLGEYEHKRQSVTAKKLQLKGVDGYTVYNISQEFEENGNYYIAGRVEKKETELSKVRIFRKTAPYCYTADFPNLVFERFQDPFVTRINGELILGGVQVYTDPLNHNEKIVSWRTLFYRGKTIDALTLFACGPNHMKDIRLTELKDGRIGIFTRPQGGLAGPGKIGFVKVNSLENVNAEVIENAQIFSSHFLPEEWGGVNHVTPLENGLLGVLGHISYRCMNGNLHYHAMSFLFDPITMEHTPVTIIATRKEIDSSASKRLDLLDVLFPGGLVLKSGGRCDLYAGISDCEACIFEINNPFCENIAR